MSPRQHQAIGAALSRLDILAKYTAPSAKIYGRRDPFGHIVGIEKRQLIVEAAQSLRDAMLEEADSLLQGQAHSLSICPQCGGPADNGHDRELPPNPYHCTRCTDSEGGEV